MNATKKRVEEEVLKTAKSKTNEELLAHWAPLIILLAMALIFYDQVNLF